MRPPKEESTTASTRNCIRTSRSRAPMASRMPISRVRSVTDTSMMFMMPIPPTRRLTAATALSRAVSIWVVPVSMLAISFMSITLKLSSSLGPRWRRSRIRRFDVLLGLLGGGALPDRDLDEGDVLVARRCAAGRCAAGSRTISSWSIPMLLCPFASSRPITSQENFCRRILSPRASWAPKSFLRTVSPRMQTAAPARSSPSLKVRPAGGPGS